MMVAAANPKVLSNKYSKVRARKSGASCAGRASSRPQRRGL